MVAVLPARGGRGGRRGDARAFEGAFHGLHVDLLTAGWAGRKRFAVAGKVGDCSCGTLRSDLRQPDGRNKSFPRRAPDDGIAGITQMRAALRGTLLRARTAVHQFRPSCAERGILQRNNLLAKNPFASIDAHVALPDSTAFLDRRSGAALSLSTRIQRSGGDMAIKVSMTVNGKAVSAEEKKALNMTSRKKSSR